jgi:hypothetical protein
VVAGRVMKGAAGRNEGAAFGYSRSSLLSLLSPLLSLLSSPPSHRYLLQVCATTRATTRAATASWLFSWFGLPPDPAPGSKI